MRVAWLCLALIQLMFAVCWTLYGAWLLQAVVQAGWADHAASKLEALCLLVFAVVNMLMGCAADRPARFATLALRSAPLRGEPQRSPARSRLGIGIVLIAAMSCAAFASMPMAAAHGSLTAWLVLTLIWAAGSAALAASAWALLAGHDAVPGNRWVLGAAVFGLGIARLLAPVAVAHLREAGAALTFGFFGTALGLASLGIFVAERRTFEHSAAKLQARSEASDSCDPRRAPPLVGTGPESRPTVAWLIAAAVAGLLATFALVVHVDLISVTLYRRFAAPAGIVFLTPVFWVGFSLLAWPASLLAERYGGPAVFCAAGMVAALTSVLANWAISLQALVNVEFMIGAASGCCAVGGSAVAYALGRGGREGRFSAALWSLLALGMLARHTVFGVLEWHEIAEVQITGWVPSAAWLLSGAIGFGLWRQRGLTQSTSSDAP